MKTGITLQQMAIELERRNETKRDYIADTKAVAVEAHGDTLRLAVNRSAPGELLAMPMTDTFIRQTEQLHKVPADFAARMRTKHPDVYAHTMTALLNREPARRMIRTLDGKARANLSDRYRPLDDIDLANAVLPELLQHPDMRVMSTQFTETRFYIKAVFPRVEARVRGDVVQAGIVISNSEVGAGALSVMPLVYTLACTNGMIAEQFGKRRNHVGRHADGDSDSFELYSDRTQRLDNAAFFAKVRDTVRGTLTLDVLTQIKDAMDAAAGQKIESRDIPAVVEVVAKRFAYNDTTQKNILQHLIEGGDMTRYGLLNAITRSAQDEEDYDVATRLERDGGRILELPRDAWKSISEAELAKAA